MRACHNTDTHGFRHSEAHSLSLLPRSAFQSNFHSWHRSSAYLPISVSLAEWVICKAMFTSTLRRFTREWSLPGVLAVSSLAVHKLAEGKVIAVHSASWLSQPGFAFLSLLVLTRNNRSWHIFIKLFYVGESLNSCFSVWSDYFYVFLLRTVKLVHKNTDNLNVFKCHFIGYGLFCSPCTFPTYCSSSLFFSWTHVLQILTLPSSSRSGFQTKLQLFWFCVRACVSAGGHWFACISL